MTQERKGAEVGARLGELLPQAELREEHHTQRKYQLPVSLTSLPLVFRWGSYCENITLLELLKNLCIFSQCPEKASTRAFSLLTAPYEIRLRIYANIANQTVGRMLVSSSRDILFI